MRKNANQIKIAARALRIDGAIGHLHFASGVGHGAVFFVSRGGRQNYIRSLRCFRQEHIVNDQQFESGKTIGLRDRVRL